MEKIKIGIVEDNKSLRISLVELINISQKYQAVFALPSCADLLEYCQNHNPSVILMDIGLPGISGIEGTKLVKQHHENIQVIIQSVFEDENHIYDAICAGADGYILKNTSPQLWEQTLDTALAGGSPLSPSIARKALHLFKQVAPQATVDYKLSAREHELLKLLVEGYSYKKSADTLFISIDTINSHTKQIYKKMQVNSKAEAVAKAIKGGLV